MMTGHKKVERGGHSQFRADGSATARSGFLCAARGAAAPGGSANAQAAPLLPYVRAGLLTALQSAA
jgi:hypothetical protein